jgi:hypothetical protein
MELSAWLFVVPALIAVFVAATSMRDLGRYLRVWKL